MKVLVIGNSGRASCISESLRNSSRSVRIYRPNKIDMPSVVMYAKTVQPDMAIIGPESTLDGGAVDTLQRLGIKCVGPEKDLAMIESSKSFTRQLMKKHKIPGSPNYAIFNTPAGIKEFMKRFPDGFVVKPDWLTGGKGVKILGEQLEDIDAAFEYCKQLLIGGHEAVVIEEKVEGEEFSLMSFCDGKVIVDMPVVQDHKRLLVDDEGPNTGGMGSYSCPDHSLPFLTPQHVAAASKVNQLIIEALQKTFKRPYKGILYGGFMATKSNVAVLEYNARFGDPEVMNVLPLLEADFLDVCEAIADGTLEQVNISFANRATVCKYLVPKGYPNDPMVDEKIGWIPEPNNNLKVYFASVAQTQKGLCTTSSRTLAFVGLGTTLAEAEMRAERAIRQVEGPVVYRRDIGTSTLIQKRIEHMGKLKR